MATAFENLRITTDFTLRLCALLRRNGVDIGTQQSIACMQAILLLEVVDEEELKGIYRTTLINRKQDLWQLQSAYERLLKDYLSPRLTLDEISEKERRKAVVAKLRQYSGDQPVAPSAEEPAWTEGYSVREVDHHKDFRLIPKKEVPAAMAELRKIAKEYATIARRKSKRAKHHGNIDLRSSVRDSVKFDGEIINWRFRRKRPTHSRFVVVSDVSGSMEVYSVFLLNFLYLLNLNHRMKVESFIFSTRLERLTRHFRSRNFQEMLANISLHFSGWSGGTKIGAAIEQLNEGHGSVITPKTTVIIVSDGWDTGDVALLDREMAKLKIRAKSIVWVNPLKGDPLYEPLAIGMATARPYCDEFISGHSLNSLQNLASLLNA